MKITCKYQVLFGQVQVQVQVLWYFHTPSTQVHQVLINMYLSTSTVLDPNPAKQWAIVDRSCLMDLEYFDVTQDSPQDCMHVIYEG